jgi:predicted PurR-regulated permease PerM
MVLAALYTVAVVWFLSWAKGLLIPLSFALLLAACLTPAVNALARAHVPRLVGAAVVLLALSALFGLAASRIRGDLVQMLDQMPSAARYVRHEARRTLDDPTSIAHRLAALADMPENAAAPPAQPRSVPAPATPAPSVVAAGTQVASLTGELAAVLFLVYLLLASGGWLQRRLSHYRLLSVPVRQGLQEVFAQFGHALHRYLGALVFSNVLLGLSIWGAFHLLGLHYAGTWGVAAAIAHFVPYLGPALFALGTALFAAVQFHSLAQGLIAAGTMLLLSTLIGVVLQTWMFGRSVRMNTVAVFISLLWIGVLLEHHRREPRAASRSAHGPMLRLGPWTCLRPPGAPAFAAKARSRERRRHARTHTIHQCGPRTGWAVAGWPTSVTGHRLAYPAG